MPSSSMLKWPSAQSLGFLLKVKLNFWLIASMPRTSCVALTVKSNCRNPSSQVALLESALPRVCEL